MNETMKWLYSFVILLLTVAWGFFSVYMTWNAVIAKTEVSIMSAAGADVLMGALLTWNGQIVTHWFRKRLNE